MYTNVFEFRLTEMLKADNTLLKRIQYHTRANPQDLFDQYEHTRTINSIYESGTHTRTHIYIYIHTFIF